MSEETKVLLGNYRVLDLTDEKGFLCGKLFGDLGADVIKIERPGGDLARNLGLFYHDTPNPGKSLYWFACNTNKRGITLNIESLQGQEIFKRLVKTADFVIESYPPGYMEKLGVGYSELSQLKPPLIMTSITPFGQSGPYAYNKASNLVCEAMGGLMYIMGSPDKGPLATSFQYAYRHAGLQAVSASLIANYWRQETGQGQHVDVSIQEAVLVTLYYPQQLWSDSHVIQGRYGTKILRQQPGVEILGGFVYSCKDGYILWRLMTGNLVRFVIALVEWMDEEGMAGELREVDWRNVDISKYSQEQQNAWERIFANFFLTKTKEELYSEAIKRGIMLFPVNDVDDVLKNPQLEYRSFWVNVEHPELGTALKYPGVPYRINEISYQLHRAPLIGEHNQEIYGEELGFTEEDLITLRQSGVI